MTMPTLPKLTKRQRLPLVETIKLWELKRDGLLPIAGSDNCALCWEFADDYCNKCPVMEETGRRGCVGTPYLDAIDVAQFSDPFSESSYTNTFATACNEDARAAATKELNFLRGILKRRG